MHTLKSPCHSCGHKLESHNAGAEGLCVLCNCGGWVPYPALTIKEVISQSTLHKDVKCLYEKGVLEAEYATTFTMVRLAQQSWLIALAMTTSAEQFRECVEHLLENKKLDYEL